jgi:hypothetical protein
MKNVQKKRIKHLSSKQRHNNEETIANEDSIGGIEEIEEETITEEDIKKIIE